MFRNRNSFSLALILMIVGLAWWAGGHGLAQSPDPWSPEWWENLPPDQGGFPVALRGAFLSWGSSPTLADLDNDGKLEIIVAGRDLVGGSLGCSGRVYAYRHNGTLFWETPVRATINSTPSVADLDGDGFPDVLVGLGGVVATAQDPQCWHGGVVALNGLNGGELWTFDTQDWLNHNPDGWRDGVFSTPAVGDLDGDGDQEIAFGSWDQCIYLLDHQGNPLWSWDSPDRCGGQGYYNQDTVWSSPALADLDDDGGLEVIIGADIGVGNRNGDPRGGYLYVFDHTGDVLAREWMDQVIYSSPAAADLDGDGDYELVVGSGDFVAGTGYYVSAFDYDPNPSDPVNRLVLKWRPTTVGRVFASPAIADLDGDGLPDVVITVLAGDRGEDGSFVYAWRGYDGAQLFQRRVCDFWGNSRRTVSSPVVADVVGDSGPEILFSHMWEVEVLNRDGTYYTDYSNPKWQQGPNHPGCARDHAPDTELTYWARYSLFASPAVGDLDADGDTEVVIAGYNPDDPDKEQGMIFAWTGHNDGHQPWPMFHRDAQHTGRFPMSPGLAVSPPVLYVLHQAGATNDEQMTLSIHNTGGESLDWSATQPAGITLAPSSGTVVDQVRVVVTVSTSGYPDGTHDLGDIVVTGTANGSPIAGSPATIPVTLYVGEVFELFIPTVLRSFGP
jgi:hypothetical protein